MLGTLTRKQCEHVLKSELVGRIGCYAAGRVYVVPVAYVFHKDHIYAHSKEGLKITMMRKNAKVCDTPFITSRANRTASGIGRTECLAMSWLRVAPSTYGIVKYGVPSASPAAGISSGASPRPGPP